jgi:hypothetical protein
MAYQAIALGTVADDGTGDSLRVGADKVNDNFVELYTLLGTGSALSSGISSSATVVTLASPVFTGIVTLPGVQAFSDGSSSAPSITNTGDTNTGIYFSEADSVDFTTGGTRRVQIDSSGLDVTGTITASAGVTVNGAITASDTAIVATNGITPSASNGAALGSTSLEWSDAYFGTGAVVYFGNSQDVTLTHVASTGLLLNGTNVIQFNDASQNIGAPSNTILDINATDEIELNATLLDVNANINASGTYTGAGLMTTGGNIVIPDAGYIGTASDTDAIQMAANGVVTFSQIPVMPANSIDSDEYIDGSIDREHLAADIIDGTKIADDAINSEHYAAGSIDNEHIADDAINSEHYAANSIDEEHIANDAVGAAELKTLSTILIKNSAGTTLKTHYGAGA